MASNLLGIGLSGLNAAQAGLATTGHNISNVNTPDYSRQQVIQGVRTPLFTGASFMGQGTTVDTVRRVYSGFLVAQTQQATASAAELDTLSTQLRQLDAVVGSATAGLAPALSEFFAGVNGVAANPADVASRQVMIADAQALVSRFHQVGGSLAAQQASVNDQLAASAGTINAYASGIATLNGRIAQLTAASGGLQQPNDLLDQRDGLVDKLNAIVGVATVAQSDGTVNVFLSSGNALVVGVAASTLVALPDATDPKNTQFGLETPGGIVRLASRDFTGGDVGGLLRFRDDTLGEARNALGQIAVVLAQTFNDQHALGLDLSGTAGGAFFTVPAVQSQPAQSNTGSASIAAAITDVSALTASDYRVAYDGASYTVTRLSDNTSFAAGVLAVDGLTISVAGGAAAAGDTFLVRPTRDAAQQIGVVLSDPRRIAAAAPIRTSVPVPAPGGVPPVNTGTGTISAGSVDKSYLASPLAAPLTLTYASAGNQLSGFPPTEPVTVTQNGVSTVFAAGLPVTYQPGATISFAGVSIAIGGAPANGDTFRIGPNTAPAGDNRNAALLSALQGAKLVGGAATYGGAYGQLVGLVGARTGQANVEAGAQDALLVQARSAQQAVSGVNLDEEAANLQRYQQAYQASAKLIAVASTMFDTILALGR